jgi:molybdopterin synthase catalytic subunit
MTILEVSATPLDVAAHEAAAAHPSAGATVTFLGVVRDHDHDRQVVALEYEAHPSAQAVLEEVAGKFLAHPDVLGLAMSHRVGKLAIGDAALVAVVSCAHRSEAFTVCAELVDTVKHSLPIWKRQVFADGTDEWVNCP